MTAGLEIADRIPNFSLVDDAGQVFLFYEFAVGEPVILLAFGGKTDAQTAKAHLATMSAWWRDHQDVALVALKSGAVTDNAALADELDLLMPLLTDPQDKVARALFGPNLPEQDGLCAVILDRNLRVAERSTPGGPEAVAAAFAQAAPVLARRAGSPDQTVTMTAPVLIVPDVLSPALCTTLIERFEDYGPEPSPMPTLVNGHVDLAVDRRRKDRLDVVLPDDDVTNALAQQITRRVLPEVQKAFWYRPTRFERLKLVSYGADTGGHFGAHRDNTAADVAHRRFAMTLNLNTHAYDGGGLVFPEYGPTVYAPPAGGAIVFSGSHAHAVQPVTRGTRYALISFMHADELAQAQTAAAAQGVTPGM